MKRSAIRRKPKRARGTAFTGRPDESFERRMFHEAAERQKRCGECGSKSAWQAHHVVYRQHLRIAAHNQWDLRDAMRLCKVCHDAHHDRRQVVRCSRIPDAALELAFELFGAAAIVYLERYYDGYERDPRVTEHAEAYAA